MAQKERDVVLFINAVRGATFKALEDHEKRTGKKLTPVVLVDKKIQKSITERNGQMNHLDKVTYVAADFDSPTSLREALRAYEDRIYAVTSQYENSIHELRKLVPYLPYMPLPTQSSLEWASEKKHMRDMMHSYDKSLVPGYLLAEDASDATIKKIEDELEYPVVVKPSGLEGSLLVSMVHNRVQLKETLKHTYEEIQKGYDTWIKRNKPAVLVEEFMEGNMFSIDTHVSKDGKCYHAPIVYVATGRSVGFDDFFGYMRLTPTSLSDEEVAAAQKASEKACRALKLRAITVHVELMQTPRGWKIIEVGPRIGGYRHDIYKLGYGINHIANDILIRADEEPHLPQTPKGSAAVFNIYAKQEGILESTSGEDKVEKLASFVSINKIPKDGDELKFAKNNGDIVFAVTLFNEDRAQLEKDIQTMEDVLKINVKQ